MEMKSISAAIAGMILLSGSALPTPEQEVKIAKETCVPGTDICIGGKVYHWPDANYDPPIIVYCNFGSKTKRYVHERSSSKEDCGTDTDQIYIRKGEELWCKRGNILVSWQKEFDKTGRHKINDVWSKSCTLRRD
jgi:hypothetical protein